MGKRFNPKKVLQTRLGRPFISNMSNATQITMTSIANTRAAHISALIKSALAGK